MESCADKFELVLTADVPMQTLKETLGKATALVQECRIISAINDDKMTVDERRRVLNSAVDKMAEASTQFSMDVSNKANKKVMKECMSQLLQKRSSSASGQQ
eukprot:6492428-Amphidinium_carterae.3